jgi:hypothetical protein
MWNFLKQLQRISFLTPAMILVALFCRRNVLFSEHIPVTFCVSKA